MILLDTNIVSALGDHGSNPSVVNWFETSNPSDFYLCTPVISEIAYGAERTRIKNGLTRHHEALNRLIAAFSNRILPLTSECALTAGRLRAYRVSIGRPVAAPDMMIAAIALQNNMTLATRNIRDFDGLELKLVNPFEAA